MDDGFFTLPLFLPGIGVWFVLGIAASGGLGRSLGVARTHMWAILLSLGIIVSATLTPQWAALLYGTLGSGTCDVSRTWLAPLQDYLRQGDTSGNVLMFMSLGAALGLMPRSRNRGVLILGGILLPFAIESIQLMLTILDRACESADVVDNLAGLVLGLTSGLGVARLVSAMRQRTARA